MSALVALASCNGHEPRLGTVAQAHVDPPPKPDFPGDVILPTEGVGYLPGGGSVSPSGNASYHIPLQVPPGRLGIQPELSLDYASGRGNGLVGVGWGLTGVGAVARCVHTHASGGKADGVDWDASDAWCMNGQKLVGGTYDPNDDTYRGSMAQPIARGALRRLLGEWKRGALDARQVHEAAEEMKAAHGFVEYPETHPDSIPNEVLLQLDILNHQLITTDDIPAMLQFLDTSEGDEVAAWKRWKDYLDTVDLDERRWRATGTT